MILTGNEAISRGFYEGGGMIASSYPGSPTVQIMDSLKQYKEILTNPDSKLFEAKRRTGKPITVLVREAVRRVYGGEEGKEES